MIHIRTSKRPPYDGISHHCFLKIAIAFVSIFAGSSCFALDRKLAVSPDETYTFLYERGSQLNDFQSGSKVILTLKTTSDNSVVWTTSYHSPDDRFYETVSIDVSVSDKGTAVLLTESGGIVIFDASGNRLVHIAKFAQTFLDRLAEHGDPHPVFWEHFDLILFDCDASGDESILLLGVGGHAFKLTTFAGSSILPIRGTDPGCCRAISKSLGLLANRAQFSLSRLTFALLYWAGCLRCDSNLAALVRIKVNAMSQLQSYIDSDISSLPTSKTKRISKLQQLYLLTSWTISIVGSDQEFPVSDVRLPIVYLSTINWARKLPNVTKEEKLAKLPRIGRKFADIVSSFGYPNFIGKDMIAYHVSVRGRPILVVLRFQNLDLERVEFRDDVAMQVTGESNVASLNDLIEMSPIIAQPAMNFDDSSTRSGENE